MLHPRGLARCITPLGGALISCVLSRVSRGNCTPRRCSSARSNISGGDDRAFRPQLSLQGPTCCRPGWDPRDRATPTARQSQMHACLAPQNVALSLATQPWVAHVRRRQCWCAWRSSLDCTRTTLRQCRCTNSTVGPLRRPGGFSGRCFSRTRGPWRRSPRRCECVGRGRAAAGPADVCALYIHNNRSARRGARGAAQRIVFTVRVEGPSDESAARPSWGAPGSPEAGPSEPLRSDATVLRAGPRGGSGLLRRAPAGRARARGTHRPDASRRIIRPALPSSVPGRFPVPPWRAPAPTASGARPRARAACRRRAARRCTGRRPGVALCADTERAPGAATATVRREWL
jgi:hypothetical protein